MASEQVSPTTVHENLLGIRMNEELKAPTHFGTQSPPFSPLLSPFLPFSLCLSPSLLRFESVVYSVKCPMIRSLAVGNQWSGPVKSKDARFHWSSSMVSRSDWSDCRTESQSGSGSPERVFGNNQGEFTSLWVYPRHAYKKGHDNNHLNRLG